MIQPTKTIFMCITLLIAAGCVAALPLAESADETPQLIAASDLRDDGRFDYLDGLRLDPNVPRPEQALGYRIGERFTRHADMERYLIALAEHSERVRIDRYGYSHQRRALYTLTISSPDNLANLDRILARNRDLARHDLDAARANDIYENNPAIVWFSYTVHGNEASTLETAIQVAYTLAAAQNDEVQQWLKDTIVVIDPLLNPDGHHRYITWFENTMGVVPQPDPNAAEHWEPWPGGRSNHYLFDLNRDWLWLVHPESRTRMSVYRQYLPQLHIDFHEQSYMHPYFLGAGDTPYNLNIPQETKDWIETYGNANAVVFDAHGLLYSSRERFDYLYPGYGKVTPVYHGAVGMLAEQAGHSRAGLAIEVNDDYTLTLAERAHNHFLLSMSNIETTAKHRRGQLERFRRFFTDACNPDEYETTAYIIHRDTDPARLELLWNLCGAHGIEIRTLDHDADLMNLRDYRTGEMIDHMRIPADSWIVHTAQPMGRLVKTIFERETEIEDPDTYDITSWTMPVAFGLRAWEAKGPIDAPATLLTRWVRPSGLLTGEGDVALIVESSPHRFPQVIGLAKQYALHARLAGENFRIDGRDFSMGSLIIHVIRNDADALDLFIADTLRIGLEVHRTARGMTEDGPVLGANVNRRLELPKIAVLQGSPTSSLSYGAIWHMLDVQYPLPYASLDVDRFGRVDLDRYNVLVVPHASGLSGALGSSNVDRIRDWVRGGGTLVAVGGGATWANSALLELREDRSDDNTNDDDEADQPLSELTYEERQQRSVDRRVSGVTMRAAIDHTHPLAAGAGEWTGIIKRGNRTLPVSDNGWVIARFEDDPVISGAISDENRSAIGGTPLMTMHRLGRGRVIALSDDPAMRGFQHGPMRLLLNAIVFGPSV